MRRRMMMQNKMDKFIIQDGRQVISLKWTPKLNPTFILDYERYNVKWVPGGFDFFSQVPCNDSRGAVYSANFGGGKNQTNILIVWQVKAYYKGGSGTQINVFFKNYTERTTLEIHSDYVINQGVRHNAVKKRTMYNDTDIFNIFGGPEGNPQKYAEYKIYGIKLLNDDILEYDLIPYKNNGIYGLLDKISGGFYRSITGVDFVGNF